MQTLTESIFDLSPPGGLFDTTVICRFFPDLSRGAREQLLHRAMKKKEILRLTDGRYCLAKRLRRTQPHPFAVAGFILFPSYVSFESALFHHGLIPEAVHEVASGCLQRSRKFDTPLGYFSYHRIPARDPLAGVSSIEVQAGVWAYVASPLRAIADLVYLRKDVRWEVDGPGFLTESMRIEEEDLARLSFRSLDDICGSIRSRRSRAYLAALGKEFTRG